MQADKEQFSAISENMRERGAKRFNQEGYCVCCAFVLIVVLLFVFTALTGVYDSFESGK